MNRTPEDIGLGEIWRSQQRTEQSLQNLHRKLDTTVSKGEYDSHTAEVKSRLVAGETRLNDIERQAVEFATSLKTINAFTYILASAFIVALVGFLFTFFTGETY